MNWKRKPTALPPEHFKKWQGGRGQYMIIWRDEAYGVSVTPGYRTLVKVDGMWDIISRHARLKRTLKAAKRACELHANLPEKRK